MRLGSFVKPLPHFLRSAFTWLRLSAAGAVLAAAALLWRVRDTPLLLGPNISIDALSAFFILVALSSLALTLALSEPALVQRLSRSSAASALLLPIYAISNLPVIAAGYILFALLMCAQRPTMPGWSRAGLIALARRAAALAPWPLAAISLLLGYGALAARGALRYTDSGAGAALDSLAFWFVLLAAAIPLVPWRSPVGQPHSAPAATFGGWSLTLAWLYPLLRLYTLGPWNIGWSFATLLVGGALAAWCAIAAFAEPEQHARTARLITSYAGLALAAIGLGSSAGIAAACYGLLAVLVLGAGLCIQLAATSPAAARASTIAPTTAPDDRSTGFMPIGWLLAGVFPFTAPFVAIWMLIGASVAGGVALLAGIAWLVALINGLAIMVWGQKAWPAPRRAALAIATISVALGISAPLLIRSTIEPVVAQMQGGLSPYGDIVIWPWVGLAASDAAHTQVATLPSIAIAVLMLVLAALVYVVLRLRGVYANSPGPADAAPTASAPLDRLALLRSLRDEVPWLGALLGRHAQPKEPPRDCE